MTPTFERRRRMLRSVMAAVTVLAVMFGGVAASGAANALGSGIVWRGEDVLTGEVGQEFSDDAGATAASSYAITAGILPPGLSLEFFGGLSGIPTETGTWVFTTTASNEGGSVDRERTVTIAPAAEDPESPPTVDPSPSPSPTAYPSPTPTVEPSPSPSPVEPSPTDGPTTPPTTSPTAQPEPPVDPTPSPTPSISPSAITAPPLPGSFAGRPPALFMPNAAGGPQNVADAAMLPSDLSFAQGQFGFTNPNAPGTGMGALPWSQTTAAAAEARKAAAAAAEAAKWENIVVAMLNGADDAGCTFPGPKLTPVGYSGVVREPLRAVSSVSVAKKAAASPVCAIVGGLTPGSPFTVVARSSPVILASGTVDATGLISVVTALPANLEPGVHRVIVTAVAADGTPVTITQWFSVTEDGLVGEQSFTGPVTDPTAVSELASTGWSLRDGLWAALALLGAGMALTVTNSNRQRRAHG